MSPDPPLAAPSVCFAESSSFVGVTQGSLLGSPFLQIHHLVNLTQSPDFKYHLYVDNLHISGYRRYLSVYTYLHMDV